MRSLGNRYFDSQFRYERVYKRGSTPFSVAAFGVTTLTIPHNLGYVPYFKLWISYTTNGYIFDVASGPSSYGLGGNGGQTDSVKADSTNVYISVSESTGAGSIAGTVYYKIFAEKSA